MLPDFLVNLFIFEFEFLVASESRRFWIVFTSWVLIYRWGDWHCGITSDNNHLFKPVCQKDKNTPDFNDNDRDSGNNDNDSEIISNEDQDEYDQDYDDYDDDKLPDQTDCFDEGVTYKSAKRDKLNTIHRVESAELCKEYCEDNEECTYWTWLRKRNGNNKCRLKSGILRNGFRRQKNRATSGTLLNGCSEKRGSGIVDNDDLKNSDFCIGKSHLTDYFKN